MVDYNLNAQKMKQPSKGEPNLDQGYFLEIKQYNKLNGWEPVGGGIHDIRQGGQ